MDRQRKEGSAADGRLPCTEALMVLPGNCGSSVTLATLQDARFTHGNLLRSYTLNYMPQWKRVFWAFGM